MVLQLKIRRVVYSLKHRSLGNTLKLVQYYLLVLMKPFISYQHLAAVSSFCSSLLFYVVEVLAQRTTPSFLKMLAIVLSRYTALVPSIYIEITLLFFRVN